ncbi:endonuclease/exonuclease/phosphatase family protein [Nocardia sp. CWNU-33]|uniref:endonuclease/exonuclease/phosphatase family protein n=1 Tax=Nocardia sp. CWNU-33 TaxID=3392117 RepID=UPI00398E35CC
MTLRMHRITPSQRRRDLVCIGGAAVLTVALIGHERVPDVFGIGIVLDSALPWLGVGIPVLTLTAALCRSKVGALTVLVPLIAWTYLFGSWWATGTGSATVPYPTQVKVVTQNLYAGNQQPAATARALSALDADLIGLQEFSAGNADAVSSILADDHRYYVVEGTVALWSRYPISRTTSVDVGVGWRRGLRAHVETPHGGLIVYVLHLPSFRLGDTAQRDHGLRTLSRSLASDTAERVVVLGDFNTTDTDRRWQGFAPGYHDTQRSVGSGPGFTWPARFPVVRPDHVLIRGIRATSSKVDRTPGTDHHAVAVTLDLEL